MSRPARWTRRAAWLVALVALGAAGVAWAAPSVAEVRSALARLAGLGGWAPALVVVGTAVLIATEALRIAAVGRIVGVRIAAVTAIDAAVANHVLTAVTPSAGLGEPAVAYVLGRRGVPWDAAVVIPFVKFTTSFVFIFAVGAVLVATGHGPRPGSWLSLPAALALLGLAVAMGALVAGGVRPTTARRVIDGAGRFLARRRWFAGARAQARLVRLADGARAAVDRLASLRAGGVRAAAILVAVHAVYYLGYVVTLLALASMLTAAPASAVLARSLTYLCWVFVAPTPGGAGLGEAGAVLFFGDLMPAPDAVAVVVGFRLATLYLPVVLGALYAPGRLAVGQGLHDARE